MKNEEKKLMKLLKNDNEDDVMQYLKANGKRKSYAPFIIYNKESKDLGIDIPEKLPTDFIFY